MKKIIRVICFAIALVLLMGPVLDVDVHAAGYTVSGLVTTSGSASDTIKVELLKGGNVVMQVSAEAKKVQYSFPGIEPGTYTLRVSKAGHETYTGTVTVSNADVVKDVTLTPTSATYTIRGAIASSGSASDAIVVELYKGKILLKTLTLTGNSVNYSFTGIAPGEYMLKVTKKDHITYQGTVTVSNADVIKSIALEQGSYTVSGHITSSGSAEDPVTVKLLSGSTLIESVVLTGNYAGYSFTGIAPGYYTVEVTKLGHKTSTNAVNVNSNVTKNITLTLASAATYTISGTVTSFGDATAPISLKLYNGTTLLKSLTLSGNSVKYSLSGIPAGTYHLTVTKAGHNNYESEVVVTNGNVSKNVPMFKIIGAQTVTLSGKISGMNGAAGVTVCLYVSGKATPSYETSRNGNGTYTISDVSPGTYVLKAAAAGYEDYSATVSLNGDTTHNITMKAGSHTCTGGKATCQSKAQCGVCNAFYGEFAAHDWSSTWDHSTAAGHGHFCMTPGCEEVSPMQAHTPNLPAPTENEDQVCTACGYVMAKAGEPAAPSVPADPSDPSDPSDPTDPTEPADPSDPTDPTDPADPGDPSAPANPTQPTKPASGDENKPDGIGWWWIVLIAVAAVGLGVGVTLVILKKKK